MGGGFAPVVDAPVPMGLRARILAAVWETRIRYGWTTGRGAVKLSTDGRCLG